MTLPYRPSAVIFDMDGLLFDTEALWQEALLSAAAEGGHEISDGVFNKPIGVPRSQCRALFLSHFGEDGICGLDPDKRFWVSIVLGKVSVDSAL